MYDSTRHTTQQDLPFPAAFLALDGSVRFVYSAFAFAMRSSFFWYSWFMAAVLLAEVMDAWWEKP